MTLALPEELAHAVQQLAAGRSRAALATRSSQISERYRGRGPSAGLIAGRDDVIAYALSRLPATHAAITTVLAELRERAPGFQPQRLLDAGAGPGTASWAAAEAWPDIASVTMMDHNRQFLEVAAELAKASGSEALAGASMLDGSLGRRMPLAGELDLVIAGYALTELSDDDLPDAVEELWRRCRGALVLVEPGRPRDYRRLMQLRDRLIDAGARMIAPCPHQHACALAAPDWCHFSVRLARSRDHMRMKGASLGYEDEKFSYLIVARPGIGAVAPGRVIGPPAANKFSVTVRVCAPAGARDVVVAKRDADAHRLARKLSWGDPTDLR